MISVMLAVYNGERYLREAIDSVLNQTYSDFEFLIVDDGSTDNSLSIIKEFAEKDTRIKFEVHKNNRGVAAARNTALEMAKGEWITLIDADDAYHPQRLETLLTYSDPKYFISDDLFICFDSPQGLIPWQTSLKKYGISFEEDVVSVIDLTTFLVSDCFVVKPFIPLGVVKKFNLKFTEGCSYGEDLEFWCHLFRVGLRLKIINYPYYYYRLTPGSLTTKVKNFNQLIEVDRRLSENAGFSKKEQLLFKDKMEEALQKKEYLLFTSALKSRRLLKAIKIAIQKPNLMLILIRNLPKSFCYRLSIRFKGGKIKN